MLRQEIVLILQITMFISNLFAKIIFTLKLENPLNSKRVLMTKALFSKSL